MKFSSALTILLFGQLSWQVFCYRILGVFPFPSASHQVIFQAIWKEMSLRGHQMVIITPNPLRDHRLTNVTEIDISSIYQFMDSLPLKDIMSPHKTKIEQLTNVHNLYFYLFEYLFEENNAKKIFQSKNEHFDLILFEGYLTPLSVLAYKFNAPIIGMLSFPLPLQGHYAAGNQNHPVMYPDINFQYKNGMDFFERWDSSFYNLWQCYNYYWKFQPKAQKMLGKYFGEDVPDVNELNKNISLFFHFTNPAIHPPRPNVPAVIEFNQIHLKTSNGTLPLELKQIVEGSKNGIIYFSLGSNVKSVNIDERLKRVIVDALTELPYTVIWKWEADHMPGRPDNVIIKKWLPQQDLLAHPKVKAFVTQGGLQSAEEAIANGVPMVGLPFFGDQPMNVVKLAEAGVAIHLDKDTVTKEELKNAILEVARNPKYREKVAEVRNILLDQPMKSIDKAIWWIEYVIRHKGARHLRSPSLDLPLYQYFLLDVIGATLLVAFIVIYVAYRIIRAVLSLMFKSKKVKRS